MECKMKKQRKWIRALAFACLLAMLLHAVDSILCVKSPNGVNQTRGLYIQPYQKVDVLFLGSSHVHCNVDTRILWEEQGIAAYLCSGAEQPLWNSYHALVDALKRQKPKLVVLDMYSPSRYYEDYQAEWIHENMDGMRLSFNKYLAARASAETDWAEQMFGFVKYHTRYAKLERQDFENFIWNRPRQRRFKGYTLILGQAQLTQPDMRHVEQEQAMTPKSEEYLRKIIELTRENHIPLALVSAPYLLEEQDQKVYNYIARLAQDNGLLFLNYNTAQLYREAGIDFAQDYADHTHLNAQGGAKYTRHLGKWLKEHYEIPDRRGEKGYDSWERQEIFIQKPE